MTPLSGAIGVATETNTDADGRLRLLGSVYMTALVPGGRMLIAPPNSGKTAIRNSFGVPDKPPQEPETINTEYPSLKMHKRLRGKVRLNQYLHSTFAQYRLM